MFVWIFFCVLVANGNMEAVDSASVKRQFVNPPHQYSSAPLWVWNDMLTEEQIVATLRDLAGQKVKQVFVHPRPGLMTPYLSADWFRLWRVALREAEAVLSQGEQINTVLLIEPTTTAWMYQADSTQREHLGKIGSEFQNMVVALAKAQVEYDIGCEDIMARYGSVEGALLKVGKRRYETIVLPPLTENLNAKMMNLLEAYLKAGGVVLCCGPSPSRVDGRLSEQGQEASQHSGWSRLEPAAVTKKLLSKVRKLWKLRTSAITFV